ncbi:MAG: acetylglutamate kinase [Rickettsiaceae bacterium]|nr:MAG: acetylglutamate kinase [Rickettsiaceae bacterium]
MRDQTIVIKLPSGVIDNDDLLTNFAENIQLLNFCGAKIFIVHDHTNMVNETFKLLGFSEKLIDDVKVVDHRSLKITEMVLSGYINKLIVAKLCSAGCCAVGISGKDANLIQAKRSKILRKSLKGQDVIDVGFTSEPVIINPEILLNFEESNIIPVISPIASDDKGHTHLLDVNLTASIISSSLDADHLMLMNNGKNKDDFKVQDTKILHGILDNSDSDQETISLIEAAASSIENSANIVHFVNATVPDAILLSIFKNREER